MTDWLYESSGDEWIAAGTNDERANWAEVAVVAFRKA
jgi:hypothetical protein